MQFLNISSLGVAYYYAIKIEENFRHKGKKDCASPQNVQL